MPRWTISEHRATLHRVLALALAAIVIAVGRVDAGSLDVAWIGPTTNADGTPLLDLAGYRIYLAPSLTPTCPGPVAGQVAATMAAPTVGESITYRFQNLTAGVGYVALITAFDANGNESSCAGPVSGIARTDISVTPTTAVSFGSVTVGTALDQTFTVQNATTITLSGTATVGAPFSVVSGGSFSLAPGASLPVVVRMQSTTSGSFASNVVFAAGADTVSRTVTGSATAVSSVSLGVARAGTGVGTVTSTPAGITCGSVCTETVPSGTSVALSAIAAAGSIFSGWSGGGCSGTTTCTVIANSNLTVTATFDPAPTTAPVPALSGLVPATALAGSAPFTLTVNGSGFASSSVVRWNGSDRATTFVSGGQLTAAITSADLTTAGSFPVTVYTPAPGGGTSAAAAFTVTVAAALATAEIIIDNAGPGVQDPVGGRTFTGTWCLSSATAPYGGTSLRSCGRKLDTYRWTPTLPAAGTYDVYVWLPKDRHASSVPIQVKYAGGATTLIFDERQGTGAWVYHGRYSFNAGTTGYVQMSDSKGLAIADAVRFVPVP
ncbi:MAG TPA: hypothetical protein VHT71_20350 [Methylomirabilota bacterium]|jgi:hypothetical protein|nr:hypothetical protein [Methylomirabilota bacterium]